MRRLVALISRVAVVGVTIFALAYVPSIFFVGIPGTIGTRTARLTRHLIKPYFDQTWKLFAPRIAVSEVHLLVQLKYGSPDDGFAPHVSRTYDVSDSFVEIAKADRVAPARLDYVDQEYIRSVIQLLGIERLVSKFRIDHPDIPVPEAAIRALKQRREVIRRLLLPYASSAARGLFAGALPPGAQILKLRATLALRLTPPPGSKAQQGLVPIFGTDWSAPDQSIEPVR